MDGVKAEFTLVGKATDEQIAMWKNLHGKVFSVETEGSIVYLKRPDCRTIGAASSIGSSDPIRFAEIMLANCWLGGDEGIKINDEQFLVVAGKLDKLVNVAAAELKEL